jgi:hypothetical protein
MPSAHADRAAHLLHLDAHGLAPPQKPPLQRREWKSGPRHQARLLQKHRAIIQRHGVEEAGRLAGGAELAIPVGVVRQVPTARLGRAQRLQTQRGGVPEAAVRAPVVHEHHGCRVVGSLVVAHACRDAICRLRGYRRRPRLKLQELGGNCTASQSGQARAHLWRGFGGR